MQYLLSGNGPSVTSFLQTKESMHQVDEKKLKKLMKKNHSITRQQVHTAIPSSNNTQKIHLAHFHSEKDPHKQ